MWLTNQKLQEILYKSNSFCCLCLTSTNDDDLQVFDQILLENSKYLPLSSMINEVCANKISNPEFVSHTVCKECAQSTIIAYKFINKCFEVNERLNCFIDNVSNTLEEDVCNYDGPKKLLGVYVATDVSTLKSKAILDFKRKVRTHHGNKRKFQELLQNQDESIVEYLPTFFPELKCVMCDITLFNKYAFKRHMVSHFENDYEMHSDNENSLDSENKGTICEKGESTLESVTKYLNCKYCNAPCATMSSLKRHLFNNCKVLKELYPNQYGTSVMQSIIRPEFYNKTYSKHCIRSEKNKEHCTCEHCNKSFQDKDRMNYHQWYKCKKNIKKIKQNKAIEMLECDYCSKEFTSKRRLENHIHFYCKNSPFFDKRKVTCSHCGKLMEPHKLKRHEKIHTTEKIVYKCQKCGKLFKTLKWFQHHQKIPNCLEKPFDYKTEKNMSCHICGKLFTMEKYLKIHINLIHLKNGIECLVCKKLFSDKNALNIHMVTHTKVKNFECKTCGGKFVSKHSLLYHTRTHTGEKPYKCELCSSRFLSASRRNIHFRVHHMEPELECKLCQKKFRLWGALNRHRKRHSNPKSSLYLGNCDIISLKESVL